MTSPFPSSPFPSFRFGGDYNPEQWDPSVWDDDVRLMTAAGVTTATVGVFSWAKLEPEPGRFEFGWLDTVIEKLHAAGIRVLLATATASPPAWMAARHPETLPVDERGVRLGFGSRQQYSPHSRVYREFAERLVRELAGRYGRHPAVEAWHANNEYGCHVSESFDEESVSAFRAWLEAKYGTIEALNRAWGTYFWSQAYASFDEVDAPRAAPTFRNPTQQLDWKRFNSDGILELFLMEKAVLAELSPGVPVTTNFMGFFGELDYWKWAERLDFVSDDEYPDPADPRAHVHLAATRDLMRSLGGGKPWLLMEQSPSAVNWRPRNLPKPPGANRLHGLQAVARGADGVLHFQWRQAEAGAEKFHAAMVPHAGPDSRVHREVQALGAELAELSQGPVLGASVDAQAAILWDWDTLWALRQDANPARIDYLATVMHWYGALLRRGVVVDFARPGARLDGYGAVFVPALHVAAPDELDALAAYAEAGGQLVVGYQTGILDRDLHAYLGGYLGGAGSALQRTLGLRVEEFAPLPASALAGDEGPGSEASVVGELAGTATEWQEFTVVDDAEVLARFDDGAAAGEAAITRRPAGGRGAAWYVATQPGAELFDALADRVLTDAEIETPFAAPVVGVETVVRGGVRFVLNHTPKPAEVEVLGRTVTVPAYGVITL
ncbi:beta-galactosidase [Gryllotalpicola ginsengisoli]|uniref:beta-galactosidase n=1 Tax=Gryllotalpicola ginsengisoli TaxID=444608 RepID=UPI0003B3D735|nr:beta-galactosidase [Gryllotalpicola ginsengisoli]